MLEPSKDKKQFYECLESPLDAYVGYGLHNSFPCCMQQLDSLIASVSCGEGPQASHLAVLKSSGHVFDFFLLSVK